MLVIEIMVVCRYFKRIYATLQYSVHCFFFFIIVIVIMFFVHPRVYIKHY